MANLLWHSTHTSSWFEYNAGLHPVCFRFLERYHKEARDRVRPFFKKPGPTTCRAQPTIGEPGIHAKVMEKINKVIRRRYLLTFGITIKLYIKYFAVPKGEDNIRMVYDATTNMLNEAVWVPTF
jgi:hypothetical protein